MELLRYFLGQFQLMILELMISVFVVSFEEISSKYLIAFNEFHDPCLKKFSSCKDRLSCYEKFNAYILRLPVQQVHKDVLILTL